MASYSTILLLSLLANGESGVHGFADWGAAGNSNFQFLEDALGEETAKTLASSDVTLTAAEERALYINLTGTLGANVSVYTNDRKGFWIVSNGTSGAYSVTFSTTSGSGATVTQGRKALFYSDGTDQIKVFESRVVGTDVQAYDAGLASIAGLTTAADRMIYTSGSDTYAVATLTSFARTILDDANAGAVRTTISALAATDTITDAISGLIEVPDDQDYRLVVKAPFAGTITETVTRSASGTATATFKVNTTALGGTANSVSSTEDAQAHGSSNTFVAGDDIVLTVSSNSSCVDLSFTIKFTRALS